MKIRNFPLLASYATAIAIVLLWCTDIRAQSSEKAYSFLKIADSSQAYALGGVNISMIDPDLSMINQNPALLGPEIEAQLGLGYMHYLGSANFGSARYAMRATDRSAWSVGMRFLSYGNMEGYDEFGTPTGTFHPQDLCVDAIYSHDITDRLRGGITMKFIYSHYERYEAIALAADLGINYYDEEHDLSLSAVIKNAGGQVKRFADRYGQLPFDVQLGYTQGLGATPFKLSITAWNLTKWKLPYYKHDYSTGVETLETTSGFISNFFQHLIFGLQFQPSPSFYLAAAYNHKTRVDMSTYQRNFLSGLSFGAGFNVKAMGFGLSYAMPHKKASTLMVNFTLNIAEVIPQ